MFQDIYGLCMNRTQMAEIYMSVASKQLVLKTLPTFLWHHESHETGHIILTGLSFYPGGFPFSYLKSENKHKFGLLSWVLEPKYFTELKNSTIIQKVRERSTKGKNCPHRKIPSGTWQLSWPISHIKFTVFQTGSFLKLQEISGTHHKGFAILW